MAKKKKGNVVRIDFTGVESGGVVLPEGKYSVKVVEVAKETGKDSGNDYLAFKFEVVDGKQKGKFLYLNKSLTKNSLWSLKGLLDVLGVEIPEDVMDLDLDDLVDRTCGVEVGHEPYNGKPRAQVTDVFEVIDGDDEEEAPKSKKAKDEEDEEEVDDTPKKKKKSKDEDDEEDDTPKKKKKKSKTYTEDGILENDEEELQALVDEHELDVDLEEFATLRRKRASVIEAMSEMGLIE